MRLLVAVRTVRKSRHEWRGNFDNDNKDNDYSESNTDYDDK